MMRSFYQRLYMSLAAVTVAMASMTAVAHGDQPSGNAGLEKLAESSRIVTGITAHRAELAHFFGDLESPEARKLGVYTTEFDPVDQVGVAVLTKDSTVPLSELTSGTAEERTTTAKDSLMRVVQSRFSAAQIDATLESLKGFLGAHQITGAFRYEARYDAVVVSAQASGLEKLNNLPKLPATVMAVGGTGGPVLHGAGMASPHPALPQRPAR